MFLFLLAISPKLPVSKNKKYFLCLIVLSNYVVEFLETIEILPGIIVPPHHCFLHRHHRLEVVTRPMLLMNI